MPTPKAPPRKPDPEKKKVAAMWKKLNDLKVKMSTSLSAASQIKGWIEKDQRWEWAKGKVQQDLSKAPFVRASVSKKPWLHPATLLCKDLATKVGTVQGMFRRFFREKAVENLDNLMEDPFFAAWASQTGPDFSKYAKKTWEQAFLEKRLSALQDLDQAIAQVSADVTTIQKMHAVRA